MTFDKTNENVTGANVEVVTERIKNGEIIGTKATDIPSSNVNEDR